MAKKICANCNQAIDEWFSTCDKCNGDPRKKPEDATASKISTADIAEVFKRAETYLNPISKSTPPTPQGSLGGDITEAPHSYAAMLYQELEKKCVVVECDCQVGSGFFLPGGYIGTNAHVVLDDNGKVIENVRIRHLGKKYPVKVLDLDPAQDVAVLRIVGSQVSKEYWNKIGSSHALKPGDPLIAIGNARGWDLSYASYTVKQAVRHFDRHPRYREVLLLNGCILPGQSGGMVANSSGAVVGITTSTPILKREVRLKPQEPKNARYVTFDMESPEDGVGMAVTIETMMLLLKKING